MELKCIRCGAAGLGTDGQSWRCGHCGASYPIVGGVPRFVAEEFYSGSFGFQWNRFGRTQLDSANGSTRSRDTFLQKTQWRLSDVSGKRVLDAGCGMGRFAEVAADAGAEVHGVDLSTAVEAARRNFEGRADIHLYQADIMNLPFPNGSFDLIYSIGVLHHTPDTRAAFLELVPLLKPGGAIAIWVYSRELLAFFGGELLRRITPRLPKTWLLNACRIAVPLYYVHRIPRIGKLTSHCLTTSMDANPEWRWLDTFDWYSPPFQWKHTREEVEAWCAAAGLTSITPGPFPVSVRAVRPPS